MLPYQPMKNIQKSFQKPIMAPLIAFVPIDLIFVKHTESIFKKFNTRS